MYNSGYQQNSLKNWYYSNPIESRSSPAGNIIPEVIANCSPSTGSVGQCLDTLTQIQCPDIQSIASILPTKTINQACSELVDFSNNLNQPTSQDKFSKALEWYENVFAPCASTVCNQYSNVKVDPNVVANAPKMAFKGILNSVLTKQQKFFLEYGLIVTIVLVSLIVVLIIALVSIAVHNHRLKSLITRNSLQTELVLV